MSKCSKKTCEKPPPLIQNKFDQIASFQTFLFAFILLSDFSHAFFSVPESSISVMLDSTSESSLVNMRIYLQNVFSDFYEGDGPQLIFKAFEANGVPLVSICGFW